MAQTPVSVTWDGATLNFTDGAGGLLFQVAETIRVSRSTLSIRTGQTYIVDLLVFPIFSLPTSKTILPVAKFSIFMRFPSPSLLFFPLPD